MPSGTRAKWTRTRRTSHQGAGEGSARGRTRPASRVCAVHRRTLAAVAGSATCWQLGCHRQVAERPGSFVDWGSSRPRSSVDRAAALYQSWREWCVAPRRGPGCEAVVNRFVRCSWHSDIGVYGAGAAPSPRRRVRGGANFSRGGAAAPTRLPRVRVDPDRSRSRRLAPRWPVRCRYRPRRVVRNLPGVRELRSLFAGRP